LGEGVPFQMVDDVSEKVRKRQSVENLKKDQKLSKRSKPNTKDESIPTKKIKLVRPVSKDTVHKVFTYLYITFYIFFVGRK
jgi:hypothetical protein